MSQNAIKIERMMNGYEVCFSDPDIVAANAKSMKMYKNPEVELVFKTSEEVLGFLTKNLDKIAPAESFDSAFVKALKE